MAINRRKLAKKSRAQGNKWMYEGIRKLAEVFKLIPYNNKNRPTCEVATTKAMSTLKDDKGIDIWFKNTVPRPLRRLLFQYKKRKTNGKNVVSVEVTPLFEVETDHPDHIPILATKITKKATKRETTVAKLFTMYESDFYEILEGWVKMKLLEDNLDTLKTKGAIQKFLKNEWKHVREDARI